MMVSVIMNGHNAEKYLHEAIDSVLSQTYTKFEIVFFDNFSTDSTREIVESYSDSRIKYFYSSDFLVLGDARNRAITRSKGEIIAFLDCDDIWLPKKLEYQVPLFSDLKVGLVYSNSIFFDNKANHERVLYKHSNQPIGMIFSKVLSNYFLSMETVLIRKKALDKMDEWFDTSFEVIEEADLFTRILFDNNADYVPKVLAKWRIHDESLTWKDTALFGKELKIMLDKYSSIFHDFDRVYSFEIKKVRARAAYREAQGEWKKGNNNKVRRLIYPWMFIDYRLLLVLLFSVISYSRYMKLFNNYKKWF